MKKKNNIHELVKSHPPKRFILYIYWYIKETNKNRIVEWNQLAIFIVFQIENLIG